MQENFLHFMSQKNCQVSINGTNIGLIDNINTMELDIITKTEKVFVTYQPISNEESFLPYTFQLNTSNQVNTDNSYIKVVPFPNNHFDIIMNPFYYYQIENSEVLLNKQFGQYFLSIVNDNITRITIFSGASVVFTTNIIKLKSAKASLNQDILTIEGIIDNDTYYLLVIDTKNFKCLFNDICHSIEDTDSQIQVLVNLKDISHHSLVYAIDKKNKSIEKYTVYENNICTDPHSNILIPKLFLECINTQDETLAKKYLAIELQSTPISKFKSYFGDIKDIYLNRHQNTQDKYNYTVFNNNYKNYNFIMYNNTIKDIEEIF